MAGNEGLVSGSSSSGTGALEYPFGDAAGPFDTGGCADRCAVPGRLPAGREPDAGRWLPEERWLLGVRWHAAGRGADVGCGPDRRASAARLSVVGSRPAEAAGRAGACAGPLREDCERERTGSWAVG